MSQILYDFKSFLDQSPTSWHAVRQISYRLAEQDFTPLEETESWDLVPGGKYFVEREGSLCAFVMPESKLTSSVILATHTDSPALKLKPVSSHTNDNTLQLGVEVYGSPLLTSWMNRELAIAGRAFLLNAQGKIEQKLVHIDEAAVFIPQLAIHLDRGVNDKGLTLNKQDHLMPIASINLEEDVSKNYLETLLRRRHAFKELLSFDLFLVPIEEARFLGFNNELIASYRIDNLCSSHAATMALMYLDTIRKHTLQMAIFFDHEEIGSSSSCGAESPFLSDILERIGYKQNLSKEEMLQMKARSTCYSIDGAHAVHPNYKDKHDPRHKPLLGKGVALKFNADQRYATNGSSVAKMIELLKRHNIAYQQFVVRSDIPSGSTVGSIIASKTGIATVDLGAPQLAMHAAREIMSVQDHLDLCKVLNLLLKEG